MKYDKRKNIFDKTLKYYLCKIHTQMQVLDTKLAKKEVKMTKKLKNKLRYEIKECNIFTRYGMHTKISKDFSKGIKKK